MTDNTWDDHVILHGAANRFETCTDMTNSPPSHYDVMTCSNRLVLGHAHELHVRKKQITPGVRNNNQTAVTNMWKTALLEKKHYILPEPDVSYATTYIFRSSSELK